MKKILSIYKAVLSLGWLGIVIVLLAGAILGAQMSQNSDAFDVMHDRLVVLNILQDQVKPNLDEMKQAEAQLIFVYQYSLEDKTSAAQQAQAYDTQISKILTDLEQNKSFINSDEDFQATFHSSLQEFNDARTTHRQTFNETIAAFEAGDTEAAANLLEKLQSENDELDAALGAVMGQVGNDRLDAYRAFPESITQAIYVTVGGLVATLLLALVGYQLISSAVRPLKSLRNTITALEGDQYRAEMQADVLKKRGPAGDLARALDQLARGIQQRDAGLKTEIENLRQALFESRRRRLKVFHEPINGSDRS